MAQMATNIKASKYHMRALGTAGPNSNTINIILHNNSYLSAVQWPKVATNMYKPKWPTKLYKPKWQQICTSPNSCTSPNGQATNTTIIICQPYNGPNGNQILTHTP